MNVEKVRSYWNEKYKEDINYGNYFIPLLNRIQSYKKFGSVIDLGCGSGQNSLFLARKGFKLTAVDVSEVALNHIIKQSQKEGLKIRIKQQDFRTALDNKYDIIIASGILHLLERKDGINFIREMQKNTKKKGLNIIGTTTNEGDFYKMKDNKTKFYPKQFDLVRLYKYWDILEYHVAWGIAAQKGTSGKPLRNKTVLMLAKKKN